MRYLSLVSLFLLIWITPLSAKLEDIKLEDAQISIIGDDSFVTRRATTYDSQSLTEVIYWRGGNLFWRKLFNNVYFRSMGDGKASVSTLFNELKGFAKLRERYSWKANKQDVKFSEDSRTGYYWISKGSNNFACMIAVGEWGVGAAGMSGNNRITAIACKPGSKENLETFIHDLMKRVRIDDGAINKLKASNKDKQPTKKTFDSTTPTEQPASNPNNKSSSQTIKSRLSQIKKLEDAGLITKEEAAKKRKAILDSL
jgi:hypothetical protein